MARKARIDPNGAWHHVMNRSIARRPVFEARADVRTFVAGLARSVRRGELEVHAWCVMTTHYHLLVRSPGGKLSDAMRRVQNTFVRYFNRKNRRDGSLFRGRFVSREVDSYAYRRAVLQYIDANPVRAGICSQPWEYPWCSARQYVGRRGPKWLTRDWVESVVAGFSPTYTFDPMMYPGSDAARESLMRVVESRLTAEGVGDELDGLLTMADPEVRRWLQRKSMNADGKPACSPLVDSATVGDKLAGFRTVHGRWTVCPGRRELDAWPILHAGLLRQLAACSWVDVARRVGASAPHARRLVARHEELLLANPVYADRAVAVIRAALEVYDGVAGAACRSG